MATAGDGRAPYESSGAGGKFRKKPFRRSAPATPYDRPPTALRNKNPGLLTKLVDPASRLIYAGANKLFSVFRNRLPPLSLQGPPETNEEPQNVSQEARRNNSIGVSKRIDQDGNSAPTGISDLEQMLKQKTFTRSEIQHLTTLLHSRTTESSPSDNIAEINGANPSPLLRLEASTSGSMKKHAAISTPFVSSKVFEERTPSPAELAKSYMGTITRPTNLINNTTSLQRTPITSMTTNTANSFKNPENGFLITPRSRGRSAMYSMARTPYTRSPNQKMSDYNSHSPTLASSQSLKRRSSVLDDDFGTGGPLRRTRPKPNLLADKRELGYTTLQQPLLLRNEPEENSDISMDELKPKSKSKSKSTRFSVPEKSTQTAAKIFQHLESLTPKSPTKLTSNMLHGQALRSIEKVDSPKFVPTSHDKGDEKSTQKSEVQKRDNGGSTSTSNKGKEKVEENGSRKFPVSFNMLTTTTTTTTTVNGDVAMGVCLKESEQVVTVNDDSAAKVPPEPPQKKRAFQMSIDDDDEDDDSDDIIHVNGNVSFPPVENNKTETSLVGSKPVSADIIKPATPPEVFKAPAPMEETAVVVVAEEVVKVVEPEKTKSPPKTDGFLGEQETGFKFPISPPTTFTAEKDKVTPVEKVSPFQFSEYKPKESSVPKPIESTSVFSSDTKNEQKLEQNPAATSASAVFSFASSAKDSSGPSLTATPDSTPSVFSSSFTASGGNTSSLFNNNSNTNITPASTSTSPPSLPTPVFSFGSGKPTTSVAETSNTDAVVEKEPKSTISTTPFFATTTSTTPGGGGLFGISSPAATSTTAAATTTTNGGGLFGLSSQAATSTTTTNGGALFGFSAPASTSTTTTPPTPTNLFGFSSPATTSTTTATANGGAPFGFSSPAATSTTTTTSTATNSGALFGFSAPAATSTTTAATNGFGAQAATSTATNGGALFGFSAPASTSTTATTTTSGGGGLFGFSSPAATSTTTSSFFTTTTPSQTNTNTNTNTQPSSTTTTQSAPYQFGSGSTTSPFGSSAPNTFNSTPTFGITSVSEGKSGNSTTTSVFGTSWQQPQTPPVYSFGSSSSSAATTPITFGASAPSTQSSMFSFTTSGPTKPSFSTPSQLFGTPTSVFANNNNNNNNDQMSMEDSMAEDSMQTPTPVASPFGQPAAAPGFMFGAPTPAPPVAAVPFQFGGAANQTAPPQNPFQSSSVEFNGGGGSFSLGSGGDKSGRRIVRVNKTKNRRK